MLLIDNGTTAMTGQQEHPGTGRDLVHRATGQIVFEDVVRAMGIDYVVDRPDGRLGFAGRHHPRRAQQRPAGDNRGATPVHPRRAEDHQYERAIGAKNARRPGNE